MEKYLKKLIIASSSLFFVMFFDHEHDSEQIKTVQPSNQNYNNAELTFKFIKDVVEKKRKKCKTFGIKNIRKISEDETERILKVDESNFDDFILNIKFRGSNYNIRFVIKENIVRIFRKQDQDKVSDCIEFEYKINKEKIEHESEYSKSQIVVHQCDFCCKDLTRDFQESSKEHICSKMPSQTHPSILVYRGENLETNSKIYINDFSNDKFELFLCDNKIKHKDSIANHDKYYTDECFEHFIMKIRILNLIQEILLDNSNVENLNFLKEIRLYCESIPYLNICMMFEILTYRDDSSDMKFIRCVNSTSFLKAFFNEFFRILDKYPRVKEVIHQKITYFIKNDLTRNDILNDEKDPKGKSLVTDQISNDICGMNKKTNETFVKCELSPSKKEEDINTIENEIFDDDFLETMKKDSNSTNSVTSTAYRNARVAFMNKMYKSGSSTHQPFYDCMPIYEHKEDESGSYSSNRISDRKLSYIENNNLLRKNEISGFKILLHEIPLAFEDNTDLEDDCNGTGYGYMCLTSNQKYYLNMSKTTIHETKRRMYILKNNNEEVDEPLRAVDGKCLTDANIIVHLGTKKRTYKYKVNDASRPCKSVEFNLNDLKKKNLTYNNGIINYIITTVENCDVFTSIDVKKKSYLLSLRNVHYIQKQFENEKLTQKDWEHLMLCIYLSIKKIQRISQRPGLKLVQRKINYIREKTTFLKNLNRALSNTAVENERDNAIQNKFFKTLFKKSNIRNSGIDKIYEKTIFTILNKNSLLKKLSNSIDSLDVFEKPFLKHFSRVLLYI